MFFGCTFSVEVFVTFWSRFGVFGSCWKIHIFEILWGIDNISKEVHVEMWAKTRVFGHRIFSTFNLAKALWPSFVLDLWHVCKPKERKQFHSIQHVCKPTEHSIQQVCKPTERKQFRSIQHVCKPKERKQFRSIQHVCKPKERQQFRSIQQVRKPKERKQFRSIQHVRKPKERQQFRSIQQVCKPKERDHPPQAMMLRSIDHVFKMHGTSSSPPHFTPKTPQHKSMIKHTAATQPATKNNQEWPHLEVYYIIYSTVYVYHAYFSW